ncbi:MAG TPA: POT family MFS transporter [Chitinophagales bacterium]|nr:POT family MFS transporter [Chitinophagales bacterium]HRK29052.1 POT family MFS transporter [Chitinophagales bacterium]
MSASPSKMPVGVPYIIGNEFAERFSYYGMKAILVVFMTQYLSTSTGAPDYMSEGEAKYYYHLFGTANYAFPLFGAILADVFWGKYKTIIWLSLVYCLGHLFLAIDDTRTGLFFGLMFIALGSGGIKPCVSANVGDQFSEKNKDLLDKIFGYFYISINMGAAISMILTPILLQVYGPNIAFAIPGVLMFIATLIFWLGRNKFVRVPPVGVNKYMEALRSPQGIKAMANLIPIYAIVAVFWSLFEQTGSSWLLQAQKMNLTVNLGFTQFDLLASQIQSLNSILILLFVPLFTFVIYPFAGKYMQLTGLRKITIGVVIAALSYVVCAFVASLIQGGVKPTILYQLFAYVLLTAAEVMVSVTALEFAYTQAPNQLKSFVMSFYLLSVSAGNFIAAFVNKFIQNPDGSPKINETTYFLFFVILALLAALALYIYSTRYSEESYLQTAEPADGEEAALGG